MGETEKELFQLHARICECLSNPKRLEILALLREGEKNVGELAQATELPVPNVSQHLAMLRERRIVSLRREGTSHYYRVAHPKMLEAFDILRQVLLDQLAANQELVEGLGILPEGQSEELSGEESRRRGQR